MSGTKIIPSFFTLLRVFLCPFTILLVLQNRFAAGIGVYALSGASDFLDTYFARRWDAVTQMGTFLESATDKIVSLSYFSLLMSLSACPSWFLGLAISATLLQCLALLLLKVSVLRHDTSLAPVLLPIARWNAVLQFVWIGLLLVGLAFAHRQEWGAISQPIYYLGYLGLATLQILVFFRYFYHFQAPLVRIARLKQIPIFFARARE